MKRLVWFRADLRIADNPALAAGCRDPHARVIAVFLPARSQWVSHDWASVKVDLILRTLAELSGALAARNIPLLIPRADRFSDAPRVLLDLARAHRCDELFFNREYELNERRRDDAVVGSFTRAGLRATAFDDQTILPPGSVLTGLSRPYTVFTPFKKAWIARLRDSGDPKPLPAPRDRPVMPCAPDTVPEEVPGFAGLRRPDLWPAGELHACRRLRRFIADRLEPYKTARNLPAINGTSVLSPYLSIGAISPRQCLAAALDANRGRCDSGLPGAVQWISELIWREFYKHLLVAFPRLCMHRAFKPQTERIRWRDDQAGFRAWSTGRTGVPIVDAAMRQLTSTGWMHNRLRMVSAMYLTKDLFIDWRRGERFFMQNLVDGDLAQNNGGWQWSASTGTDAAPYFRIFNPSSQGRACDPDGAFIRQFLPELASLDATQIHEPWRLPASIRSTLDYPQAPIVDHQEARRHAIERFRSLNRRPE